MLDRSVETAKQQTNNTQQHFLYANYNLPSSAKHSLSLFEENIRIKCKEKHQNTESQGTGKKAQRNIS